MNWDFDNGNKEIPLFMVMSGHGAFLAHEDPTEVAPERG